MYLKHVINDTMIASKNKSAGSSDYNETSFFFRCWGKKSLELLTSFLENIPYILFMAWVIKNMNAAGTAYYS